jgi:hypothetical protein
VTPKPLFWPTPSQTFALVANPRLGLRQLKSMIKMQQQQKTKVILAPREFVPSAQVI